jgi:hypothetical protein
VPVPDSVPSRSVDPLATYVPPVVDKVPFISDMPVAVVVYEPVEYVAADCTIKVPFTLTVPPDVLVPD